jgi:uncharacterized protein
MYNILIIPLITVVLAQIIKSIIDMKKNEFSWSDLNSYGGMPSAHAAFVISLAICAGYFEGLNSAAFAISVVYAILTIRDAGGYRQELGKHAKILNQQIAQLPAGQSYQYPRLKERLGHTPLQLLGGITLGVIIPVLYIWLFV